MKNLRIEYGRQLVKHGQINPNIVVLEADLKESTQSIQFQEKFPDRFFEMGIAEQNMVGVAAGLARCGKIPVVHSFASFISMKACEQVRTNIAFQKLNVKLVVSHAGVSAGSAGTTHHTIEDIAIMRSLPNMTVMVPGDAKDVELCFDEALRINGPVYLRISASDSPDTLITEEYRRSYRIQEGSEIAILTTGVTLSIGRELVAILAKELNIKPGLIHVSTIKPLEDICIAECARKYKWIFTIEEHNIIGGFGSALSEICSEISMAKLYRFGIRDHYCTSGSQNYIFEKEGLSATSLAVQIMKMTKR